jgi:Na+/proline symporter
MLNNYLIIAIILLPIIIFLTKIKASQQAKNTSDFFLADKKMESNELINSTVAYGYQIAAVSLFATWGYTYGFWTIWVPLFWVFGFYILKWLNDSNNLDYFFTNNNGKTIHGFIDQESGRSNSDSLKSSTSFVGIVAALASILGLSGTAFFEAEFTSKVISNAIFTENTNIWFVGLFVFFVGVALSYILYGGLKTVAETDGIKLSMGFIFFNLFALYIFVKVIQNGNLYTGGILCTFSAIAILFLNILYPQLKALYPDSLGKKYSFTLIISFLIYLAGIIYAVYALANGLKVTDSLSVFVKDQQVNNILSLGNLSLISLLLANSLWQIVDVSSWQRLAALNRERVMKPEISKTLVFIGWYSGITWLIAIFFGMALKYVGVKIPDAFTAIQDFTAVSIKFGNIVDQISIMGLFISMIFIMFSTLDSLISAISYTVYYDVVSRGRKDLKSARISTFLYTLIFLIIYYFVRQKVSTIDTILYTFYSFQLALFPSVLATLLRRKTSKIAIVLSILFGSIGALIPLLINSETINPYTSSAIFTTVFSAFTLLITNSLFRSNQVN